LPVRGHVETARYKTMHMHTVKSIEYINVTHNSDPEKEHPALQHKIRRCCNQLT